MVPAELAPFRSLFVKYGAPQEFSAEQYEDFLADLANTFQSHPLPARELEQAVTVSQVWSFILIFTTCSTDADPEV